MCSILWYKFINPGGLIFYLYIYFFIFSIACVNIYFTVCYRVCLVKPTLYSLRHSQFYNRHEILYLFVFLG